MLGSAVKLVFYRYRPWVLFGLHVILLVLWETRSCGEESGLSCENPRYPVREGLENFGLGFTEINAIITMCLLVVSFYCSTCIGIYREMYFMVIAMGSRIATIASLIRTFEEGPERRWSLTRHKITPKICIDPNLYFSPQPRYRVHNHDERMSMRRRGRFMLAAHRHLFWKIKLRRKRWMHPEKDPASEYQGQ